MWNRVCLKWDLNLKYWTSVKKLQYLIYNLLQIFNRPVESDLNLGLFLDKIPGSQFCYFCTGSCTWERWHLHNGWVCSHWYKWNLCLWTESHIEACCPSFFVEDLGLPIHILLMNSGFWYKQVHLNLSSPVERLVNYGLLLLLESNKSDLSSSTWRV